MAPEAEAGDAAEAAERELPLDARIHYRILHRKKEGVEALIDAALAQRKADGAGQHDAAVDVLNGVLLPAMKEVGDKFGAGELILPYVLQSAEVMKRSVAHLEQYLEKVEGVSKGKVILATVYGDVHDIGKSLVNTILSNNGYTVYDLGKQVPVNVILDKAVEVGADAIGLSALLVSTSRQMPLCAQELHHRGLTFPLIIGGAAINRRFGRRINWVDEQQETLYGGGVYYCKDAFEGLSTVDQLLDPSRREALLARLQQEVQQQREEERARAKGAGLRQAAPAVPGGAPLPGGEGRPGAGAPLLGPPHPGPGLALPRPAAAPPRPQHPLPPPLEVHHPRPRGVAAPGGRGAGAPPAHPVGQRPGAALADPPGHLRLLPRAGGRQRPGGLRPGRDAASTGTPPGTPGALQERLRFTFPRQVPDGTKRNEDQLCLADYFRPVESGQVDVVAFQVVTAGEAASEYAERLRQDGQYNLELEVHGVAAQTAEAMAEYVHALVREQLRTRRPAQGPALLLGLPRLPGPGGPGQAVPAAPGDGADRGGADRVRCSSSPSRARRPWWCTTPRRSTSPSSAGPPDGAEPLAAGSIPSCPKSQVPVPGRGAGSILGVTGTEPAGGRERGLPGRRRPGRAAPGRSTGRPASGPGSASRWRRRSSRWTGGAGSPARSPGGPRPRPSGGRPQRCPTDAIILEDASGEQLYP